LSISLNITTQNQVIRRRCRLTDLRASGSNFVSHYGYGITKALGDWCQLDMCRRPLLNRNWMLQLLMVPIFEECQEQEVEISTNNTMSQLYPAI